MHLGEAIAALLLKAWKNSQLFFRERVNMKKRLFITGYASINNLGEHKDGIWENFCSDTINRNYGLLNNFTPADYLGTKGLQYMSRSSSLLLAAMRMIYEEECLEEEIFDNNKVGVAIGTVFGSLKSICDFDRITVESGPKGISPMKFANCVKNGPAANISIRFGMKAFNVTLASGMSSALDAVCYGGDMLLCDKCEAVFAGGVEEFCEQLLLGFKSNGLVTDAYHNYLEPNCSEGVALSEGTGLILIKSSDSIVADEHVYSELKGYKRKICTNGDLAEKMEECMLGAIYEAGLHDADIDIVMGSFNGIDELDYAEESALNKIFSHYKNKKLCIPKRYFGETYSAGGGIALNLALQILERQSFGGEYCLINATDARNKVAYIEEKEINNILVNSFDLMGQLVSVIIGR